MHPFPLGSLLNSWFRRCTTLSSNFKLHLYAFEIQVCKQRETSFDSVTSGNCLGEYQIVPVLSRRRVPERQGLQRSELSSLNNAISFLHVCFRHHQQHRPVQPPCRFSAILEAPSPPLLVHPVEDCLEQQQADQAVPHRACLATWVEVLRMRNPVRHKHQALEA
jgi:hypothetical protein